MLNRMKLMSALSAAVLSTGGMVAQATTVQPATSMFQDADGTVWAVEAGRDGALLFRPLALARSGWRLDANPRRIVFHPMARHVTAVHVTPVASGRWIVATTAINGATSSLTCGLVERGAGDRLVLRAAGVVDAVEYERALTTEDGVQRVPAKTSDFRAAQLLSWDEASTTATFTVELLGSYLIEPNDRAPRIDGGVVMCSVGLRPQAVVDGAISRMLPRAELPAQWVCAGCDLRVVHEGDSRYLSVRETKGQARDGSVNPVAIRMRQGNAWPVLHRSGLAAPARYDLSVTPSRRMTLRSVQATAAGVLAMTERTWSGQDSDAWGEPVVQHFGAAQDSRVLFMQERGQSVVWKLGADGSAIRESR